MRGVIQQTLCQQMTHFSRPAVNSTAALVLRSLSDEPETRAQTVILYVFIRSPMTSSLSRHPAFLSLQGGINFRDLGGQLAADGRRVRSGKLLRSGALNRLTAEDLNHLDTLPLSRVLDYRDPGEVARTPDKLSPLTHYLNAPANPPEPPPITIRSKSCGVMRSAPVGRGKDRRPADGPSSGRPSVARWRCSC